MKNVKVFMGLALAVGAFVACKEMKRAEAAETKITPACAVVEYPRPLDKRTQIPMGAMQIYGDFSVPVIVHLKDGRTVAGGVVDGDASFIRLKVSGGFCDLARKEILRMEKGAK